MSNSDLKGVIVASATPVDSEFGIDCRRLAQHCERLLNDGCSFISTFGTTGEGTSLSSNQKIAAMQALKAEGIDLARHIPSVMTSSADEAGRMVAEAARLGARAALVLPPFYYDTIGDDGVVAFFEDMLAKAGRPDIDLLLYNIPRFSRISYTPALIEKLIAKFGSAIVGIKDSTGDAENSKMLARSFPGLSVFTGDDRVMPGLVEAGGAGMIGGMPNLFAADLCRIYEAPSAPETRPLRDAQAERIMTVDANGSVLALKVGLAVLYGHDGWKRAFPPLMALDDEQTRRVFDGFAKTGYVPKQAA